MGRNVTWTCDWCDLESADEHAVETWHEYGVDLLCPTCEDARANAIRDAVAEARRGRVASSTVRVEDKEESR